MAEKKSNVKIGKGQKKKKKQFEREARNYSKEEKQVRVQNKIWGRKP
jgi:hypothetical protein